MASGQRQLLKQGQVDADAVGCQTAEKTDKQVVSECVCV